MMSVLYYHGTPNKTKGFCLKNKKKKQEEEVRLHHSI